ncbi:MAG: hypothetical protein ACP5EP_12480 [Acidobacteriaceae bacterium]
MSSLKTHRIRPVVMRLKPDTPLPPQNDLSRDDLIDGMALQMRVVFDTIPAHASPVIVESGTASDHAELRVVASRKFIIEAHDVGPCNTALRNKIQPYVFETMKVLLRVFGMAPASIEMVEQ